MSRECTNQIIEMVDEGLLDARSLLIFALQYMSENDVKDMCDAKGIEWESSDPDEDEE